MATKILEDSDAYACSSCVLVTLAIILVSPVRGDEQSPAKAPQDPAILELLTTLADDFGRADMKDAAALWTADADFLAADGTRIRGRETIEKAFAEMMAVGPKRSVKFQVVEVRHIGKDVAMVDAIVRDHAAPEPRPPTQRDLHAGERGRQLADRQRP